jgi:hypothetical protein
MYKGRISVLDIFEYYPDRLPYLRNEIYARYGRPFVNKVYQDYFNRQRWYRLRGDYTDAWLSDADKYNAELIRAIEQAPAGTEAILARNIEYSSRKYTVSFGQSEVLVAEDDDSYSSYGLNEFEMDSYVMVGDWAILYDTRAGSSVLAFRLDHRTRSITASDRGSLDEDVLNSLIRAQHKPPRLTR